MFRMNGGVFVCRCCLKIYFLDDRWCLGVSFLTSEQDRDGTGTGLHRSSSHLIAGVCHRSKQGTRQVSCEGFVVNPIEPRRGFRSNHNQRNDGGARRVGGGHVRAFLGAESELR